MSVWAAEPMLVNPTNIDIDSRGRVLQRTPSRFLLEIPDELLEIRDLSEEARQQVPKDEVRSFFANFEFPD